MRIITQAVTLYSLVTLFAPLAHADFRIADDGKALTITDSGKPVLVYNYALVSSPEGVDPQFRRAAYIHPLYGLDGDTLTQDFPSDHYHHRGVFWGWPESTIGDRVANVWALTDIRQYHEKWIERSTGGQDAVIAAQNVWRFDDSDAPVLRETCRITVHAADDIGRAIDITLTFTNTNQEPVVLRGTSAKGKFQIDGQWVEHVKGYGGFTYRPNATRKPFVMTSILGEIEEDTFHVQSPWIDFTSVHDDNDARSGVAVFQHPDNPGYPHHHWLVRGYGLLGASWPGPKPHSLAPGESVELRYRLFIHRGTSDKADVQNQFTSYTAANE
jgi:hypothetical protein